MAARAAGWRAHLLCFAVATVETALARIARRVSEGGHAVPEINARRRFIRSIANFPTYATASDLWRVFDANGGTARVVAEGRHEAIDMSGDLGGLPSTLAATIRAMSG